MPIFTSNRKVQKFGSSLAITLPALFVKINEIQKGCKANAIYDLNGILIVSWVEDHESFIKVLNKMIKDLEKKELQKKIVP